MYEKILVPLDGSELAEQVIPYVEELAGRLNSEVILITVFLPSAHLELPCKAYIEKKAAELQTSGLRVSSQAVPGDAATEILSFAEKHGIGLIIISTHGHTGISHWPLGSIASKVVQRSHIPVFLVRSSRLVTAPEDKKLKKILITLDGSPFAEAIIPHIENLAKGIGSEVVLARVVEPVKLPQLAAYREREKYELEYMAKLERQIERYLSKKKSALRAKGIKVSSALLRGKPAETLIQYAEDKSASLIALTTHGFSGITKWAYGSVASRIIEGSSKPVFLIRPPLPPITGNG